MKIGDARAIATLARQIARKAQREAIRAEGKKISLRVERRELEITLQHILEAKEKWRQMRDGYRRRNQVANRSPVQTAS